MGRGGKEGGGGGKGGASDKVQKICRGRRGRSGDAKFVRKIFGVNDMDDAKCQDFELTLDQRVWDLIAV